MDTLFNFGDVYKDFLPIARDLLGDFETVRVPITNTPVYSDGEVQIVSACYGIALVRDTLIGLKNLGRFNKEDVVVGLGSCGSFSNNLSLDDLVLPLTFSCKYYGYENKIVEPDVHVFTTLCNSILEDGLSFDVYHHGSVFAVFDEHTDHKNYTNSLYRAHELDCVDCSESYDFVRFSKENGLRPAVLLYVSDDPENHIISLPKGEFDARAIKLDCLINRLGYESIKKLK